MNYYRLDHDGTLVRGDGDYQMKYMPGKGWVRTQLLNTYPHTAITEAVALGIIRKIEKPSRRKGA